MKSKIAVRLSLYFSAALIVLSLIIGVLFMVMFRSYTLDAHKKDMAARAESIAAALSDYMSAGAPDSAGGGAGKSAGGYGAYLRFIDDIAGTPVWLVDENLNLLTTNTLAGGGHNISDLPEDAGLVVTDAFKGSTTFSEGFSSVMGTPTLTVGTPITAGGRIVGAVLMHTSVEGISESADRGMVILAVSMLAALLVTAAMSFFLASKLTTPLKKMTASTARLAAGDYTVKTEIARSDEIGGLAESIDSLSIKLLDARRATEKLDGLRRDFVANVSHELRTPIAVLRGSLEALCDGVVTEPAQVRNYYSQMLGEVISLQRLVNDLMELSRLQNADFTIEMSPLNLNDVVSDAVRSARQLAASKRVDIVIHAGAQPKAVLGDYSRLKQMFLIVLDNAVKFSPEGGEVSVTLENNTVTISDRGPGIPPEDRPYIFDRFYKTKSEDNKTGSGLGLAIARQIAGRHGIAVSISPERDEGAEFVFTF